MARPNWSCQMASLISGGHYDRRYGGSEICQCLPSRVVVSAPPQSRLPSGWRSDDPHGPPLILGHQMALYDFEDAAVK